MFSLHKVCTALVPMASVLLQLVTASSSSTNAVVPRGYMVEFAKGDQSEFYSTLAKHKISAEHRLTLNHDLFNGVSFFVDGSQDNKEIVETIRSMDMVHKLWPLQSLSHPAGNPGLPIGDTSIRKRELVPTSNSYTPHVMAGVDKLHAEGYTGDGIFIGILDSGVDYTHPALGGGFGEGFKVVEGTDLVGDSFFGGDSALNPDDDPADCYGHGTHVAGIVGADQNPYNFTGVAPNATLGMWRIFGCSSETTVDVVIKAFNLAYEAGVDLITASIVGDSGWVEDPLSVAIQRITEKGVPCLLAGGNSGSGGLFTSSVGSESIGATGVAATDNTQTPEVLAKVSYTIDKGAATDAWYFRGTWGNYGDIAAKKMKAITFNTTVIADACEALPADTPSLADYVVLIRRGVCAYDTKSANVAAFGAKTVIFYNNVDEFPRYPIGTNRDIPIGMVSRSQGEAWIKDLEAGKNIELTFTNLTTAERQYTESVNELTGGSIAPFSSWGPTNELWIKPEVSAPGGNILSTYPVNKGSYLVDSGTSMSTPFMAGVVALMKQVRGTLTPDQITSILATTATPANFNDGTTKYDFLAPVVQQGGGNVNAFKAAHTSTLLDLDNIALNDTANFKAAHPFTINNVGDTEVTYSFENLVAATVYTFDGESNVPVVFPPKVTSEAASAAKISFQPTTITIPAKSSGIVTAAFTAPESLDKALLPIYSGYIAINGSNSDSLTLPYAGAIGNMKDLVLMDYANGYPALSKPNDTSRTSIQNYTSWVLPAQNSNITTDLPIIRYFFAMGTAAFSIDLVPENANGTALREQSLGLLPTYPLEYAARGIEFQENFSGLLADGSYAPAGTYKLVYSVLKIFGDRAVESDYERYESPYFKITYEQ